MAVAKVILNGNTLIDTTDKTVTSGGMLSGVTALKNDGTSITGSISTKTSSDLTASGATVTAPAGYYASSASKSVSSGSATTPATTITANPSISVSSGGLITASVSASQSVTPSVSAGYVSSGTAGTVSVSGSNTSQLTVYNGAHHQPTPADYTVTVSLTNPVNPSKFQDCTIYEALSSTMYDWGDELGSISSSSGSANVTVPAASYGICVVVNGTSVNGGTPSGTGGVTFTSGDVWDGFLFHVTGDGTATIDGIDYDD